MRLNEDEKEAPPSSADAQPPAARSTRFAQELAAGKRCGGRPKPGWVGPRWKTKKDGQPENYNYERYCAQRVSMPPKKSGKKGSAREKDGTPNYIFHGAPSRPPESRTARRRQQNLSKLPPVGGCIGTELCKQICILRQFSNSTKESSGDARHYDATKNEANPNLNPTGIHLRQVALERQAP